MMVVVVSYTCVPTCLCVSDCASSSGMKSRQMCMEGTPETIMGSNGGGSPGSVPASPCWAQL